MKVMWPFRKAEELDRDVHAELQHVKVVIAQVESLRKRWPSVLGEEGDEADREICSAYNGVLDRLRVLESKLGQADARPYEVDAG